MMRNILHGAPHSDQDMCAVSRMIMCNITPGAPHAAQDIGAVIRMIPHDVEGQTAVQPLVDGRHLPGGESEKNVL
jgi:hypothetical protein